MASSRSTLNEAQTRQQLIDQQLARAGWGIAERRIVEEYLLSSADMRFGSPIWAKPIC
jgi:type I site-specific restriction endonuclease